MSESCGLSPCSFTSFELREGDRDLVRLGKKGSRPRRRRRRGRYTASVKMPLVERGYKYEFRLEHQRPDTEDKKLNCLR
jgi:hypothetical protein